MIEQLQRESNPSATSIPRCITTTSLSELLDFSPDPLVVVNQAGIIVQANEQVATLFGHHLPDLLGAPLDTLLPECRPALHAIHREVYCAAPYTRTMGCELDLLGQHQSGGEVAVGICLRPVFLEEDLLVIGTIHNVSQQLGSRCRLREQGWDLL